MMTPQAPPKLPTSGSDGPPGFACQCWASAQDLRMRHPSAPGLASSALPSSTLLGVFSTQTSPPACSLLCASPLTHIQAL